MQLAGSGFPYTTGVYKNYEGKKEEENFRAFPLSEAVDKKRRFSAWNTHKKEEEEENGPKENDFFFASLPFFPFLFFSGKQMSAPVFFAAAYLAGSQGGRKENPWRGKELGGGTGGEIK